MKSWSIGDRVLSISFDPLELPRQGTVVEVYTTHPDYAGASTPLYSVLWDGETAPARGYFGNGLLAEHEVKQKNAIKHTRVWITELAQHLQHELDLDPSTTKEIAQAIESYCPFRLNGLYVDVHQDGEKAAHS